MVFGNDYDKTLWIILNEDRKNKKLILDFIKGIPVKIYKEMLNMLSQYKKNDNNMVLTREFSNQELIYYFSINPVDNSISIGKYYKKKRVENECILLKLYPYVDTDNIDIKLNIGSLIYQLKDDYYDHILDCDKVKYSLAKTCVGVFFVKSMDYAICFSNRLKLLNCNKIPSEIGMDTLEDTRGNKILKRIKEYSKRIMDV